MSTYYEASDYADFSSLPSRPPF